MGLFNLLVLNFVFHTTMFTMISKIEQDTNEAPIKQMTLYTYIVSLINFALPVQEP